MAAQAVQVRKIEESVQQKKNKLLLVVSKGTADALYPALILATTGVAEGMETHLYFTFGGMKLLTKTTADWILPSVDLGISADQLKTLLSKGRMPSLRDMLRTAIESGVKIHACSPTMMLFGTKLEDLVAPEDIDVIGAATLLELASDPNVLTLFI
ncbi:MAG: DsrE/DsrF/DrsH-like family protein [archaeon]|nr:DsrE/DsrF/DrsH-like family protein [archaeon]